MSLGGFDHRHFRLRTRDWKRVHFYTLARTVLDGLLLSNLTTPTRNRTLMAIDLPSWQFWKAFFFALAKAVQL